MYICVQTQLGGKTKGAK